MTGEVRQKKIITAERGRHVHIDGFHQYGHFLLQKMPGAIGLNILHRRNESRCPEDVRPGVFPLSHQEIVFFRSCKIIKNGGGLSAQNKGKMGHREVREGDGNRFGAQRFQDLQHSKIVRLRVRLTPEIRLEKAYPQLAQIHFR